MQRRRVPPVAQKAPDFIHAAEAGCFCLFAIVIISGGNRRARSCVCVWNTSIEHAWSAWQRHCFAWKRAPRTTKSGARAPFHTIRFAPCRSMLSYAQAIWSTHKRLHPHGGKGARNPL